MYFQARSWLDADGNGLSAPSMAGQVEDGDGELDISMLQRQQEEVRDLPRMNALNAVHSPPSTGWPKSSPLPHQSVTTATSTIQHPSPDSGQKAPSNHQQQHSHNTGSSPASSNDKNNSQSNSNSNNNKASASKLISKLRPK